MGVKLRVYSAGCRVQGSGRRAQDFGIQISGLRFRVWGLGLRVSGLVAETCWKLLVMDPPGDGCEKFWYCGPNTAPCSQTAREFNLGEHL